MRFSNFGLEVSGDRERAVVRPSGEVDIATAGQLQEAVIKRLNRGCAHVVVDLRAVTFLDSSGISALIACHRRAQELAAVVAFIVGGGCTRRVLELTGVIDYVNLEFAADDEHILGAHT